MSKRKSIDEIFRSGLQERGLPYAPEYWKAAESGLNAHRGSIRKKRVLLILLFMLGGSALFWLGYVVRSDSGQSEALDESIARSQPFTILPSESILAEEIPQSEIEVNPLSEIGLLSGQQVQGQNLTSQEGTKRTDYPVETVPADVDLPSGSIFAPQTQETSAKPIVSSTRYFEFLRIPYREHVNSFDQASDATLQIVNSTSQFMKHPKAWAWYIGTDVGITKANRDLGANNEQSFKRSEKVKTSATYGLNLFAKRGHWTLGGGLARQTVREQHNYEVSTKTWQYDTSIRMTQPYYTETKRGTRVALIERFIDSNSTVRTSIPCADCETNLNYLRIPLSIQYEFGEKRLAGFAGIGINYWKLLSASGDYALPATSGDGEFAIRELSDLEGMRRNLIFWQAEAGMRYRINRMWILNGAVSVSRSNNSLFDSYTHRIRVQQARIGLEYRIR